MATPTHPNTPPMAIFSPDEFPGQDGLTQGNKLLTQSEDQGMWDGFTGVLLRYLSAVLYWMDAQTLEGI